MNQLFVYGTLKRGHRNSAFLQSAIFLGEFTTAPVYSMFDFGSYPAVTLQGTSAILGEVFQVDQTQFEATDKLEGYPEFYQRDILQTDYGNAWIYIVEPSLCVDKDQIYSGQWELILPDS